MQVTLDMIILRIWDVCVGGVHLVGKTELRDSREWRVVEIKR